ncbi:MAG: hypothetical protein FWF49_00815 [Oscillospiraceae bacterium]|nr:hypothetical protein [Oscillospiraceae bacterium]
MPHFYINPRNKTFIDYIEFCARVRDRAIVVDTLHEANACVILGGQYLMAGYKPILEADMAAAREKGIPVYAVAPHGTGYIPWALRGANKHAMLDEVETLFQQNG